MYLSYICALYFHVHPSLPPPLPFFTVLQQTMLVPDQAQRHQPQGSRCGRATKHVPHPLVTARARLDRHGRAFVRLSFQASQLCRSDSVSLVCIMLGVHILCRGYASRPCEKPPCLSIVLNGRCGLALLELHSTFRLNLW